VRWLDTTAGAGFAPLSLADQITEVLAGRCVALLSDAVLDKRSHVFLTKIYQRYRTGQVIRLQKFSAYENETGKRSPAFFMRVLMPQQFALAVNAAIASAVRA
jgi:hypothetical protein